MRKIIHFMAALFVLSVLCVFAVTVSAAEKETVLEATGSVSVISDIDVSDSYKLGDVDGDNYITVSDARICLRRAIDLEDFSAGTREYLASDISQDGIVDVSDARLLLRTAIQLDDLSFAHRWSTPDCTAQKTCEECGVKLNVSGPHLWHLVVKLKEPTCVENGIDQYECWRCNAIKTENIPSMGGHRWRSVITKYPTCKEKGEEVNTCVVCNTSITSAIPVAVHNFVGGSCTTYPKCQYCGLQSTELGHSWGDMRNHLSATCTLSGKCNVECYRCHVVKETVVPSGGHSFSDGRCIYCGATTYLSGFAAIRSWLKNYGRCESGVYYAESRNGYDDKFILTYNPETGVYMVNGFSFYDSFYCYSYIAFYESDMPIECYIELVDYADKPIFEGVCSYFGKDSFSDATNIKFSKYLNHRYDLNIDLSEFQSVAREEFTYLMDYYQNEFFKKNIGISFKDLGFAGY